MVLITGGIFQGKLSFTKELYKQENLKEPYIVNAAECNESELLRADIINNFHLFIQKKIVENKEIIQIVNKLIIENKKVYIIVAELGCGVVPIDKLERIYREEVGRVSCKLAKASKSVYRIICGIGSEIKREKTMEDGNERTNSYL